MREQVGLFYFWPCYMARGIKPTPPTLEVQSINHWTAKVVLLFPFWINGGEMEAICWKHLAPSNVINIYSGCCWCSDAFMALQWQRFMEVGKFGPSSWWSLNCLYNLGQVTSESIYSSQRGIIFLKSDIFCVCVCEAIYINKLYKWSCQAETLTWSYLFPRCLLAYLPLLYLLTFQALTEQEFYIMKAGMRRVVGVPVPESRRGWWHCVHWCVPKMYPRAWHPGSA